LTQGIRLQEAEHLAKTSAETVKMDLSMELEDESQHQAKAPPKQESLLVMQRHRPVAVQADTAGSSGLSIVLRQILRTLIGTYFCRC